jgi:hypothetical protein
MVYVLTQIEKSCIEKDMLSVYVTILRGDVENAETEMLKKYINEKMISHNRGRSPGRTSSFRLPNIKGAMSEIPLPIPRPKTLLRKRGSGIFDNYIEKPDLPVVQKTDLIDKPDVAKKQEDKIETSDQPDSISCKPPGRN